jgi:hypothetical protein
MRVGWILLCVVGKKSKGAGETPALEKTGVCHAAILNDLNPLGWRDKKSTASGLKT